MLKLLRTSLQSTMGNDRLNGLALMLIHRDVELNDAESSHRYHAGFINKPIFTIAQPKVIHLLDAVNIKSF